MIICNIKIGINICEPHYMNLFFVNLLQSSGASFFFTLDIFLTAGGTYLCLERVSTLVRGCTFLGNLRKYFYLGGCDGPESIFLFWVVCWACQLSKYVKLSKRCQISKSQTSGLWRMFTKKIGIIRLTHININFDVKYEGH